MDMSNWSKFSWHVTMIDQSELKANTLNHFVTCQNKFALKHVM